MKVHFVIKGIPPKATHSAGQRVITPKEGKPFIGKYEKGSAKQARNFFTQAFVAYKPPAPLQGPLMLSVTWAFAWRVAEPKRNRVKGWKYCTTRPDNTNLIKMPEDVLSDLDFWNDDSQVSVSNFVRIWSDNPRIEVKIEELEPQQGELI